MKRLLDDHFAHKESMNHSLRLSFGLPWVLLGSVAFAQDAASPAPAVTSASAAQIQAQLQQSNEQLAKLRASIAQAQTGIPAGAPPVVPAVPGAGGAPVVLTSTATLTMGPKPVPEAPNAEEIRRLEAKLSRARAQRRAVNVAEAGTITASSAVALRSQVVFPYVENSIYEIYAAPDRMTAIELQPGEVISTENGKPKAADTVQWVSDTVMTGEGAERKTIVMVKPIITGVETNMLIPTNRHLYSILLRAESRAYMPLVAFSYPADEVKSATPTTPVAAATTEAVHEPVTVAPEDMNFGYRVKGPKVVWTPVRVFDDGTKTYLQMPPQMKSWESPALFVLEERQAPELVNYRVKGDYYIVDRLFHQAQLRIGTKHFVNIYRDERAGS